VIEVTADAVPQPLYPVTVYVLVTEGVNETPYATPPVQEYDNAPDAVRVTLFPKHLLFVLLETASTGGDVLSERLIPEFATQFNELVPMSE
jgi:hypothetical protein